MPKRKFIDKKNAVTFQVVHRSQQDPLIADETAPRHVLVPVGSKKSEKAKQDDTGGICDHKEEQIQYGIYFDDDYNYLQHLKTVGDPANIEWAPVPTASKSSARKEDLKDIKLKLPSSVFESAIEEKVGLLNKAAPESGLRLDLDPEVVAAMDDDFDFDSEDNLLQDDFMKLANSAEPLADDDADDLDDGDWDDYDSDEGTVKEDDDVDSDHFPLDDDQDPFKDEETRSRFTSYSMTSSVVRRNKMLTLLDDRFEKIFEQYDDTELGALDTEEIEGHLTLSDNRLLALADEFEKQLEEEKAIGNNMITAPKGTVVADGELVDEDEEDSDPFATSSEDEEQFDCVSILTQTPRSEYMPTIIDLPSNKQQKIKISKKNGIPLNTLGKQGLTKANLAELDRFNQQNDEPDDFNDETESVLSTLSILSIRAKNETPEERKARKNALKEYRKERRMEKKANTIAFKEEKKRQEKVIRNQKVTSGLKIV